MTGPANRALIPNALAAKQMSPHTKRSAKLPNASSFFPPLPVPPSPSLFSPSPPPPFSPSSPTPRRRPLSPQLSATRRRARMGAAAGEKAKRAAPLLAAWRLPHGLGGARRLPWTAGFLWARGLAQAAAGRAGRQKGTKKPLLSRIRAKIRRKILQFAPPCVILCMPRNSIDNVTRYKRAFLYLFFSCDFIYAKE